MFNETTIFILEIWGIITFIGFLHPTVFWKKVQFFNILVVLFLSFVAYISSPIPLTFHNLLGMWTQNSFFYNIEKNYMDYVDLAYNNYMNGFKMMAMLIIPYFIIGRILYAMGYIRDMLYDL